MERAYREQRGLPQFFHVLLKVYAAGHFPCGWEGGKYPRGALAGLVNIAIQTGLRHSHKLAQTPRNKGDMHVSIREIHGCGRNAAGGDSHGAGPESGAPHRVRSQ